MQQSGFSLIDDSIRGDCEKRSSQQDISEESVFLSSVSEEQRRKELENSPEDIRQEILAYKKVANRVRPVATTLPEEFRIIQRFPSNPLTDLPKLPTSPPNFSPGKRYTQERMEQMKVNTDNFLWPEGSSGNTWKTLTESYKELNMQEEPFPVPNPIYARNQQ